MSETIGQLPFDDDASGAPDLVGAVPGLSYLPGWITPQASSALLTEVDAQPWSTQLKRRVQHYGQRYHYGRRGVAADDAAPPLPDWARAAAARLAAEELMDRAADQVIVNEYQPGQGISAHIDSLPDFGPVVAAISLGAACVMDFTNPADGTKLAVQLAPGSLLVMAGPARFTWRHGIAARRSDPSPAGRVARGRRVSITFRTLRTPDR